MDTRFPPSDHCDGRHFFNPVAALGGSPVIAPSGGPVAATGSNPGAQARGRGLLPVLRWQMANARAAWPARVVDPVFAPPPASVQPGSVAVTFINHASFLIRLPGAVVLTDPIFSERCSPLSWAGPKRVRPPGVALADLPRPDVVLITHNHYDHMDQASLRALQRHWAPSFVTMLGNARRLAGFGIEATELDWWQDAPLGAGSGTLRVTATPARHFSARTPFDRNRALWGGFMLGWADGRVLFAGDSGAGPHWTAIRARLGAPDLALLPIGAYEPRWFMAPVHMNPSEAVQAHLALGARQSVGMHFGTFQLTDEAIDAPLEALAEARDAMGMPADTFTVHGFGETRIYALGRTADPGAALRVERAPSIG